MNQLIKMDEEYRKWIEDIGKRYKQRQIKASVSVNQEMIGFYWSIGRDIALVNIFWTQNYKNYSVTA